MRGSSTPHKKNHAWLCVLAALLLGGCAGYQQKMGGSVEAVQYGQVDQALVELERNTTDKDLLYYLELGELLRMKGDYVRSRDAWLQADAKVRAWEDEARHNPEKLMGELGALVVNDTTRRYDGRDYEKVMLSVRLALDHLALGDWDSARTEIKKMHEREAIIAEFRSKELDAAREKAEDKGLKATSFKDLNGYPVETLDDPEVRALKNAYESAFANYLAGFVYEALGEPSLAAAGYRKAVEMRPGVPLLEQSLAELDGRVARARGASGSVDTLFVLETGTAPSISSQTLPIPLPIPRRNGVQIVMTPLSWPVLSPMTRQTPLPELYLNGKAVALAPVTSIDHMARRALADEMPSIIVRSSVRAILKGIAQKEIQDNASGTAGAILSIVASIVAVASEQADERGWRTLPAQFSIGRAMLAPGVYSLAVPGMPAREVSLSGSHSVVVLRITGRGQYLAQMPYSEPANPVQPVRAELPSAPPPAAQPATAVNPAAAPAPEKKVRRWSLVPDKAAQ